MGFADKLRLMGVLMEDLKVGRAFLRRIRAAMQCGRRAAVLLLVCVHRATYARGIWCRS